MKVQVTVSICRGLSYYEHKSEPFGAIPPNPVGRLLRPALRAREEGGGCPVRDSSPGPGTEDHTALWLDSSRSSRLSWQVPENGEVPNTTSQDTWLPGLLPPSLSSFLLTHRLNTVLWNDLIFHPKSLVCVSKQPLVPPFLVNVYKKPLVIMTHCDNLSLTCLQWDFTLLCL